MLHYSMLLQLMELECGEILIEPLCTGGALSIGAYDNIHAGREIIAVFLKNDQVIKFRNSRLSQVIYYHK